MNRLATHIVTEFVLLGFPGRWEIQIFLFSLFLVVYALALLGNGAITCAVRWDPRLHSPMYFLLGNFAFLEIWYVSSTVPNMLVNILSKTQAISFSGCFLHNCVSFAICHPLHYPTIMTRKLCGTLVSLCWLIGFLGYPIPIFFISQLPFCGPNIIDHFLCDMDPLMALSCAPAPITEFIFYTQNSSIYTLLFRAVFQAPSAAGRRKDFSICGSHLAVVSLFYGTVMVMYVSPTYGISTLMQKILTLVYSIMIPFLNPLIYSLCNKDRKLALRNVLFGMRISQNSQAKDVSYFQVLMKNKVEM
ncbi:hypothetical protein E2I00_003187, partial [Balaenoptera physalus]